MDLVSDFVSEEVDVDVMREYGAMRLVDEVYVAWMAEEGTHGFTNACVSIGWASVFDR